MTDLVPPGHHPALFVLAGERARYRVVDGTGRPRLSTGALGIALAVAQRVAAEDGRAWITAADGSAVRLDADGGTATATPRPWINTISHATKGASTT